MQGVVFVVLAAIWLVAFFIVRRRVFKAMLEGTMSVGKGAVALGSLWAIVPLFALAWQPDLLPIVLVVAALVFVTYAGVTLLMLRLMGRGPFV
jgi:hypothetical protein